MRWRSPRNDPRGSVGTPDRRRRFAGNPYLFLGRRPFREARLRSYIVGQHRAGRSLAAILADPYIRRCGSESYCWQVVIDARTLEALHRDVCDAIGASAPPLRVPDEQRRHAGGPSAG